MGVQLDDDEVWAFVGQSHTGILTTLDREGYPISLPTWHVVINNKVYLRTLDGSAKARRINADDRVSFLVEGGEYWVDLKAVLLVGHAHQVADPDLRSAVTSALVEKYESFRKARRELPSGVRRHYSRPEAIIEVVADRRTLSWDNQKIRSR
jgi:nitroimidazol reductase NimA-like FMN-containing flavoprotein (pyridoxamine 5'-phosphate oxidase superfamily)